MSEKPSHTHAYLYPVISELLKDLRAQNVLDLGCGNGSLTAQLLADGYNAYGIDASEQGIAIAADLYPGRFFVQDFTDFRLPNELDSVSFDTIVSVEVIEHLYQPRSFISYCKDILVHSQGRNLVLTTPYHGYIKNLLIALLGRFDEHATALWEGGHIKFWSRKTLTKLLVDGGFYIQDFKGAGRLPYIWKSMIISAVLQGQ